jgi:hypothetical protein
VKLCLLHDRYLFYTLSSFCTPAQYSCNLLLLATMCLVKKELISYLLQSKSPPHSMGKCSSCVPCLCCNYGNVMPFVLFHVLFLARSKCSFPSPWVTCHLTVCCLCLQIHLSLVPMDAVNDCEGGGSCLVFFLWEAVNFLIHVSTSSSVWSTFVWWTMCI